VESPLSPFAAPLARAFLILGWLMIEISEPLLTKFRRNLCA